MREYEACKYCKPSYNECDTCTYSKRDRILESRSSSNSDGDFLTSAVVAAVTDSTLTGFLVGGDLMGSMLGDSLFGDD